MRRVALPSFLRLYSLAIVGSASLLGAFATLQLMSSGRPGLARYAAQFVFHDGLRSVGPLASTAALVLALVFWAERQRPDRLRRQRRQVLRRALFASLPGYLVASVVVIITGLLLLLGVFDQAPAVVGVGASVVRGADLWVGARAALLDSFIILFLADRFLARLNTLRTNLAGKLIVALLVAAGVHASLTALLG